MTKFVTKNNSAKMFLSFGQVNTLGNLDDSLVQFFRDVLELAVFRAQRTSYP